FSTVVRLWGHQARNAITGITLFAGFASTVGWPLSAWLEIEFGWRTACLAWAGLHLFVGLPLNASLPTVASHAAATVPADSSQPGAGEPPGAVAAETTEPPRHAGLLLALVFAITWFI